MAARAPDLVLGMCGGYGAAVVRPFLRSLRATGFAGEVALLTHGLPPGAAAALAAEGAAAVPVALAGVPDPLSYNVARYAAFAAYLASRAARRVLLTDVRDVVFQRDPFGAAADESDEGVHLFLEHPARPIGGCIWTSSWIRYRYGDAALPPLAARPIVCSGVVLGAARAVAAYLGLVAAELPPDLRANNYMAGYDQGVVNRLCHAGRVPALTLHAYAAARVLHLGNAPAGAVARDARGEVVNEAGEVAALVHQYDRHPALAGLAGRWG
jgi:hypothetical protein